jgi:excisionase family DNA binding protein
MPRKPDPRWIKVHRVYTVAEAAEVLGLHRQTVLRWIKSEALSADRMRKPWLVDGAVLKAFLGARRWDGRCRLALAQLYCLGCRAARIPDGRLADFTLTCQGAGTLMGLCPNCGAAMYKAVRREDLEPIRAQLDVLIRAAQPRIVGGAEAPVIVDLSNEDRTHATQHIG